MVWRVNMSQRIVRRRLIDSLKQDLMGPREDDEILERIPTQHYITGIIYPEVITEVSQQANDDDRDERIDEDEEVHTENLLPRSMGLSMMLIPGDLSEQGIVVRIGGAIYQEISKEQWIRKRISGSDGYLALSNDITNIRFSRKKERGGKALKDLPGSIGAILEGFEVHWETHPVRAIKGEDHDYRSYLSVFIVNKRKAKMKALASNSFYQTYIAIETPSSLAIITRELEHRSHDDDLESLSMLYTKDHEFAVGHQVSVNWDWRNDSDVFISQLPEREQDRDGSRSMIPKDNIGGEFYERCGMVETSYFPECHRRSLDFQMSDIILNMFALSDKEFLNGYNGNRNVNLLHLKKLTSRYQDWIERTFSSDMEERFQNKNEIFQLHRTLCERSLSRMEEGLSFLEQRKDVYQAFCLMNRAMWLNWINKKQGKGSDGPYVVDISDKDAHWRPFQMGFILQNIANISDPTHPDRDLVDLLWVPTGGGKTEAYLGLVAFMMFLRRIRKEAGADDGLEVMMRYTLRLLTLQQFQRAAKMILACEHIRIIDDFDMLRDCKEFSIGLYVGQSTTPNKVSSGKRYGNVNNDYQLYKLYEKDADRYDDLKACKDTAEYAIGFWKGHTTPPERSNPVQITHCPWCGFELRHNDYIIDDDRSTLRIVCGYGNCLFHTYGINILTVDDDILASPPSLLIGTVDKFAQLPLNERLGGLFGWIKGEHRGRPPSLIIQDELHLINGPLGSMTGLYEASIDLLSSTDVRFCDSEGRTIEDGQLAGTIEDGLGKGYVKWGSRPKVIASTATIRNANRQCRNLFDRGVFRFPSPGLDLKDSFFVKERDDEIEDKAYVGIFCGGCGMKTTSKKVMGRILVDVVKEKNAGTIIDDYDPYWTIISYFNSRRELGGAVTLLRDDIRTNIQDQRTSMENDGAIGELHGGLTSTDLPKVLNKMERRATDVDPIPYDVLLCTNMFSVGVDVDRLGAMAMNCQPKATTEYLQSTGRVGRTNDGLVLVLFNQARPRDQSHFERFYDYHSRIQLHVESMTVTPFSEGSLDRALHAQYVALMRHMLPQGQFSPIRTNQQCKNYTARHRDSVISILITSYFIARAQSIQANAAAKNATMDGILNFQAEWLRFVKESKALGDTANSGAIPSKLQYSQRGWYQSKVARLLETDPSSKWFDPMKRYDLGFRLPPFLTPNSLRNVEEEIVMTNLYPKRRV